MSCYEEVNSLLEQRFAAEEARAKLKYRLGWWSTSIEFHLPDEVFHLVVDKGVITAGEGKPLNASTTVKVKDKQPVLEVLTGTKDITHFLADCQMKFVKGDYFDLINLSKAAYAVRKAGE